MDQRTITRADLSESVFQEVGLSRNESADLVEVILGEIADALARGETVKISSFGSFSVRDKGQRVGRNPKTGESVGLAGKHVPHFKPGKEMRDRVNDSLLESNTESVSPGRDGTGHGRGGAQHRDGAKS